MKPFVASSSSRLSCDIGSSNGSNNVEPSETGSRSNDSSDSAGDMHAEHAFDGSYGSYVPTWSENQSGAIRRFLRADLERRTRERSKFLS